ncbi:hypothetical protein ES703_66737 [subsurface metagenome]
MQIINILGNHAIQLAQVVQLSDSIMTAVRFGICYCRPELSGKIPVLLSTCLAGKEVLIIKLARVKSIPNSSRASEIGDTRLCTDTGTGEDHDPL